VQHALSVDVEDWHHDSGVDPGGVGPRVETNTDRLLQLFADYGSRATFFVLGDVAARYPALVRRIAAAGHELGSHGYSHRPVMDLTRRELRDELRASRQAIEDATGVAVKGFRAPYFSIKAEVRWPVDIIHDSGFAYDASILAIDRPPGLELVTSRAPYQLHNGLWEVPVALLRLGRWHLPLASGAGLRFLPACYIERLLRRFEREVGAGVFYLHPWEVDPLSPTGPGAGRWLLRIGRERLEPRWRQLSQHVQFAAIRDVFAAQLGSATADSP